LLSHKYNKHVSIEEKNSKFFY